MADDSQPGPDRQVDVYMEGMAGITPDVPTGFEELEARALETLDEDAYGYVAGAAGAERTKRANDAAFEEYRLLPRMLRDVGERDLSVELFGTEFPAPVLLAPIGVQSILHDDGEAGSARAARDLDLPFVVSSASDTTLEELAEELGDAPKWFQLYWSADRDIADSFVARAEDAGYDALVVTLDTPLLSWRERDVDSAYLPFLDGDGIANYLDDPAFRERLDTPPEENELVAIKEFVDVFGNPELTWDDLAGLCEQTDLPVVPKGVLHPDDARAAVDAGADAVVVSNHGGRQVDNAVPALEMLPEVVDEVGDEVPVLFDSGIRRGADVLVALALGADSVLFGRPYAYGLALEGEDGVHEVCENLLADLDLSLGLCGLDDVSDVDESLLRER
jgi:lactate 2-monooxygenase